MLDHKGCNSSGTNEESCLLMHSKHQPKQSPDEGHNFHAGLPLSVLSCPPRHLFSSPFNHCLFTLSQELNEPRLRALPGKLWRPRPALPYTTPSLPPPLCSIQPPPTTPPQHIVHSHTNTYRVMELPPPLPSTHID